MGEIGQFGLKKANLATNKGCKEPLGLLLTQLWVLY